MYLQLVETHVIQIRSLVSPEIIQETLVILKFPILLCSTKEELRVFVQYCCVGVSVWSFRCRCTQWLYCGCGRPENQHLLHRRWSITQEDKVGVIELTRTQLHIYTAHLTSDSSSSTIYMYRPAQFALICILCSIVSTAPVRLFIHPPQLIVLAWHEVHGKLMSFKSVQTLTRMSQSSCDCTYC